MRASDCPNLSSRVHSDSAEGGNRSLVGRHDVRGAVRPSREIPDGLLLLWRLRPYSFCRCARLCSRPLAPGRGILCLQDGKGQNIEQVCSRQAWPRHCFVERQHAAHRGKTVGQYRCIPGLTGRPSPPVLRRATKQPSAHNDNRVSLAEPCERDELVAVRTDDGERTIGTVGKTSGSRCRSARSWRIRPNLTRPSGHLLASACQSGGSPIELSADACEAKSTGRRLSGSTKERSQSSLP